MYPWRDIAAEHVRRLHGGARQSILAIIKTGIASEASAPRLAPMPASALTSPEEPACRQSARESVARLHSGSARRLAGGD
jgi:hypothetical protein